MINTIYSNSTFSIELKDKFSNGNENIIFSQWTNFEILKSGVYTLEGTNGSGKSILIKMILGAEPPGLIIINGKDGVIFQDKSVRINNVKKAINVGINAIFQSDTLIPTMTIREQLMLRHLQKRTFLNYVYYFADAAFHYLEGVLHLLNKNIHRIAERIRPNEDKIYPEHQILTKVEKLLDDLNLPFNIIDKYPNQLSGGTLAKVKVMSALLYENTKLLFIDEAFNAVAKDDWPKIVDLIKNWAKDKGVTIVVVTHNESEVFRWQPNGRFIIENKKITIEDNNTYDGLDFGIHQKDNYITKFFSYEKAKDYLINNDRLPKPVLLLIDKAVINHNITKNILFSVSQDIDNKGVFVLDLNEQTKTLEKYSELISAFSEFMPRANGSIIVIGGGVLLNFGSFVASTLHRGRLPLVLVPTTIMAMADVAIGSKASLNIEAKNGEISHKHIVGTYFNPNAIILDKNYLGDNFKKNDKILSLSECYKHGLLQDKALLVKVSNLLQSSNQSKEDCFEVALRTMELKSSTLINDNYEVKYGRVLLYGHLHAHSIERFMSFTIPHGLSVYWGMILDLRLGNNFNEYNTLLNIIKHIDVLKNYFKKIINEITHDKNGNLLKLNEIYNNDAKNQHFNLMDNFMIIQVNDVGQYSSIGEELVIQNINWSDIVRVIDILITEFN